MKFSGEVKFPEIDHPGVPVQFVIDGLQAELVVGGESLGRWSLYDVHARRLVASAFQVDLGGTEVTFVADDPIDFAYRGVEHMAETWASIKSKQMGRRAVAIRKSRKGTIPSRIEELRDAMEANLEVHSRPLAGEPVMPSRAQEGETAVERDPGDWDARDPDAAIPVAGVPVEELAHSPHEPVAAGNQVDTRVAEEMRKLEEERQRIAEERARLEAERLEADRREEVRIEAYRLEMQRLEAEREELRREAALAAQLAEEVVVTPGDQAEEELEPEPVEADEEPEVEAEVEAEPERVEAEPVEAEKEPESEAVEAEEEPEVEAEVEAEVEEEPERVEAEEEPEPVEAEEEPEPVEAEEEPEVETEPEPEIPEDEQPGPEDGAEGTVVDLSHLEEEQVGTEEEAPAPAPQPQAALAGTAPTRERGGLRGAVRAAFTRGSREHEHQFIEAPGGIGIIRYVCEICGYVSISVGD